MNGLATGIAIHAITTIPRETIAPARVPGTDILPKAPRDAGRFLWIVRGVNHHLPAVSREVGAPSISDTRYEQVYHYDCLWLARL
jgi:hypothetical protein